MFWQSLLLAAAAVNVAALPRINPEVNQDLSSRVCPLNSEWFDCKNHDFHGCCQHNNPCDSGSCDDNKPAAASQSSSSSSASGSSFPPTSSVAASATPTPPSSSSTPTPTPTKGGSNAPTCNTPGKNKVFQPKMQNIKKGTAPVPEKNIELRKKGDDEQSQLMTFSLPAGAKNCKLGWNIPGKDKREFTATVNGYVQVAVADNNGAATDKKIGGADFANWPQDTNPEGRDSNVGAAPCQESLTLRADPEMDDLQIHLVQNEETGWYISYEC